MGGLQDMSEKLPTVFVFPPAWGLPSFHPLCMATLAYLKMKNKQENKDYKVEISENPKLSDTDGELPVVQYYESTERRPLQALSFIMHKLNLTDNLSPAEEAQVSAFQYLMETKFYKI